MLNASCNNGTQLVCVALRPFKLNHIQSEPDLCDAAAGACREGCEFHIDPQVAVGAKGLAAIRRPRAVHPHHNLRGADLDVCGAGRLADGARAQDCEIHELLCVTCTGIVRFCSFGGAFVAPTSM